LIVLFLGTFVSSLVLSFVLTKIVRDHATRRGWVVAPGQDRHLHSLALPRLGGMAIVLSFLLALTMSLLLAKYLEPVASLSLKPLMTILPPALLIFVLGICDDVYTLGPVWKFSVEAVAAAMLFAGGLRIFNLPLLFGAHRFSWFTGLLLTIVWVIAITNAFNLIDGLDGLAAGSALFSTFVAFVVALLGKLSLISLITLSLAGSILGFLRYNFNPATIFLGDCGSLFIGFMLSSLALYGTEKAPTIIAVSIPLVSFGLPILETSLSVVRRFISGKPVFTADRQHIHHKLLDRGLSHRQVVIVLYGVSAMFALLSLFLLWPTGSTIGLVLAVLGTGIWMGVQHLGYPEFGEIRRIAQRTIEQRHILVNNLAIRRATEELKVAQSLSEITQILMAAFTANDFDAFELRTERVAARYGMRVVGESSRYRFLWRKSQHSRCADLEKAWSLRLDLLSPSNQRCGEFTIFRTYAHRDLQLDINLLTAAFATALANAVERATIQEQEFLTSAEKTMLVPAQAG
ncbi:MAG: undecaprenyl/decaprenyl-phosphate alpha-N-acetylglucosaminyl 1-phosphate transferase, partial [Acidobacteria bacterium]|nr:undecaprenyl/decaprenyl-phosphate alpha-N-acetylglucosaminyl 1-phosphate transferase [Acidobacteriota bacterium]